MIADKINHGIIKYRLGKVIFSNHVFVGDFHTKEELSSQIHEQGLDHVSEVSEAYLEGDGQISIIKNKKS
ncbi:MAG: DUF421 domain-containing protein [Candidatus Omnitrophica bacterium]|nr:DUF421 domain-containing protein [Candidatus Omnitrophota bacterium]